MLHELVDIKKAAAAHHSGMPLVLDGQPDGPQAFEDEDAFERAFH